MSTYNVPYTDSVNKGDIVVEEGQINREDTSLAFVGDKAIQYGLDVSKNFLHLLENFAGSSEPMNAIEGQMWYDNTTGVDQLKVFDGATWVSSGSVKKGASLPDISSSLPGDLWADTNNQQLYLNTGVEWILVGPEFSAGLSTGPRVDQVVGTNDTIYPVLKFEVDAITILIISKSAFTPKTAIRGFSTINKGVNISTDSNYKYNGIATSAENLVVGTETVQSTRFLRSDVISTTNNLIRIRDNNGLLVGSTGQLALRVNQDKAVLRSTVNGSGLDLLARNTSGVYAGISVLGDGKVGINKTNPTKNLDVSGNAGISGDVIINSATVAGVAFDAAALQVIGGTLVGKSLRVGESIYVTANVEVGPAIRIQADGVVSGISTLTAQTINATTGIVGNVTGNLTGTATTAQKLTAPVSLQVTGDALSADIPFDGTSASLPPIAVTLTSTAISSKDAVTEPQLADELLVNRGGTLSKISQEDYVSSVNPIGSIRPYAGSTPSVPPGHLVCDGSLVSRTTYASLFTAISTVFGAGNGTTTFELPTIADLATDIKYIIYAGE
jgi:hypothetical protein